MPVIRPEDATIHELHGNRWTSFVRPGLGSDELCGWRVDIPAGTTGAVHSVNHEEVLLVLEGTMTFIEDDHERRVEAGDVIVFPINTPCSIDNRTSKPATAWVTTRVGFEATMDNGTTLAPEWVT